MYQENKKQKFGWLKNLIRGLIAILVVILTIKLIGLYLDNSEEVIKKSNMDSNLKLLDETAKKYFNESNYPKNVGDSLNVTLKSLVDDMIIEPIKDENGEICNLEESYIKVTKLENEYQIKSYLVCENKTDYFNSFIELDNPIVIKPSTTTTKKVTKKKTTNKKTTTKKIKQYHVAYNSNGGSRVDGIIVDANDVVKEPIPIRAGYRFVGWYYHGAKFDFSTKINQDYVLTAKWSKN